MFNYDFDLIIIGSGPGGYIAALKAAKIGLKTAIIEKNKLGGVCLNQGCIPTKTLLKSAKILNNIKNANKYGILFKNKNNYNINWNQIQNRKTNIIEKLISGIDFLLKSNKIEKIFGIGSAIDKNTILVQNINGDKIKYTARYLIIATGSKPKMFNKINEPQGFNIQDLKINTKLLTSTEILNLKEIPKSLTIIGGGVIGVEFAFLFNELGTQVTIIEYLDRILISQDKDISILITEILKKNNVKIITNHVIKKLENNQLIYYNINDKKNENPFTIINDYYLLSIGREPIIENFTNLNIKINNNGGFTVNNKLEAIDINKNIINNIYIIGDVNNKKMLAHAASIQGLIAVNNIFFKEEKRKKNNNLFKEQIIDYDKIPNCIYSYPEVASIGLTELECQFLKKDYLMKKKLFNMNGKALADGEIDGFVKIIIDKKYGEILGVHIICSTATDIIAEIASIMQSEGTIFELSLACHPHPTMSELIMEVAQDLEWELLKK